MTHSSASILSQFNMIRRKLEANDLVLPSFPANYNVSFLFILLQRSLISALMDVLILTRMRYFKYWAKPVALGLFLKVAINRNLALPGIPDVVLIGEVAAIDLVDDDSTVVTLVLWVLMFFLSVPPI